MIHNENRYIYFHLVLTKANGKDVSKSTENFFISQQWNKNEIASSSPPNFTNIKRQFCTRLCTNINECILVNVFKNVSRNPLFSALEYRPKSFALKAPMDLVILDAFSEFMGSFFIVFGMVVWLGEVVKLPTAWPSSTTLAKILPWKCFQTGFVWRRVLSTFFLSNSPSLWICNSGCFILYAKHTCICKKKKK